VLSEQQHLRAKLRALREVRSFGQVRNFAALVLDGQDASVGVALDHIDLGGDAEPLGREPDGARLVRRQLGRGQLVFLGAGWRRKLASGLVCALVRDASFYREGIVRELALGPLEVKEALAVKRLVDHAGRDEVGSRARERQAWERLGALGGDERGDDGCRFIGHR